MSEQLFSKVAVVSPTGQRAAVRRQASQITRFNNAGLFFIAEGIGPVQVGLWFPDQIDHGPVWIMAHPEISKSHFPRDGLAGLSLTDITKLAYYDDRTNGFYCIYTVNVTNIGNFGTFFSLEGGKV